MDYAVLVTLSPYNPHLWFPKTIYCNTESYHDYHDRTHVVHHILTSNLTKCLHEAAHYIRSHYTDHYVFMFNRPYELVDIRWNKLEVPLAHDTVLVHTVNQRLTLGNYEPLFISPAYAMTCHYKGTVPYVYLYCPSHTQNRGFYQGFRLEYKREIRFPIFKKHNPLRHYYGFQLAQSLEESNNMTQALYWYHQCAHQYTWGEEGYFAQTRIIRYMLENDTFTFEQRAQSIQRALFLRPDRLEGYYYQARLHQSRGEYAKCVEAGFKGQEHRVRKMYSVNIDESIYIWQHQHVLAQCLWASKQSYSAFLLWEDLLSLKLDPEIRNQIIREREGVEI